MRVGGWQAGCIGSLVEVTSMDNPQQNYDKDRDMEKDPDARTAKGSNDPSHHAPGAGITNRPDEEEKENQERLPPRGQAKAGG